MSYIGRQLNVPASTVELTADIALTAGNAVLVNADGKGTKPGSTTLGSELVVFSGTSGENLSAFDSSNNKVAVIFQDGDSSDAGKAAVVTVSGTTCSVGSITEYSSSISQQSVAFDSTNNRVVVVYRDGSNSNYGTARVGTISGTSISFGTAVVFNSGSTQQTATVFDSGQGKIVIAYRDNGNSNYGTAIVGTVSGTSISFGSEAVFESAATGTPGSTAITATFDSSNGKVVIAYVDGGNSNYGTAIVASVSGTSLSYGTAVVFESATTTDITTTFDSANNKVFIGYSDGGNSQRGTAIIGTVSSNSISFGTAVVYTGTELGKFNASTFNSDSQKIGLFTRMNSDIQNFFEGSISGTTVSFGSATQINDGTSSAQSVVYDTNSDVFVFHYRDTNNSNNGTVRAFDPGPAVTSTNFVGFAEEDATANGLVTVQLGGSINDKQTSLTAGQTYFVQGDGTIGTTAASPSVTAGTAISATEILVKG